MWYLEKKESTPRGLMGLSWPIAVGQGNEAVSMLAEAENEGFEVAYFDVLPDGSFRRGLFLDHPDGRKAVYMLQS